ncbi:MAG: response regulator transcription factor [Planctomycetaceae bacterium]|nr:response regulator transcription factor [Planctomycetales bacterium]MCB9940414.1 response regulator transcription factor [Planctomycetaceae bacterium]
MAVKHPLRDADNESPDDVRDSVFVVDDDVDMRRSLDVMFQDAGLSVNTFASPEEFLEYFRPEMRGCLVLDLQLPGMSGLELQEALANQGCQLPFIMITGYGDVPQVIEAFRRGAVDFIEKPFHAEQLLSRVRNALESMKSDLRSHEVQSGMSALCEGLTPRERELMDFLVSGLSTKQAALEMGISPKTAYVHRARVLEKMQVESVLQLVQRLQSATNAK